MKSGRGTLLGNAGEYFVIAELLRRDIIAGLLPRNAPGMDILATTGKRSFKIRVKTKSDEADSWVWMAKGEGAAEPIFIGLQNDDRDDLTALVAVPDDGPPTVHIVRTNGLDALLKKRHREWLARPGKRGQAHNPSKMRRLIVGPELEALCSEHGVRWEELKAP